MFSNYKKSICVSAIPTNWDRYSGLKRRQYYWVTDYPKSHPGRKAILTHQTATGDIETVKVWAESIIWHEPVNVGI